MKKKGRWKNVKNVKKLSKNFFERREQARELLRVQLSHKGK
jgi:hypothetical protein